MCKKIFISHSTKDSDFVAMLSKFIIELGVSEEAIFCSSIHKQGAREKIPDEISNALKTSVIDIIILSNEYKKSEYCLNEAGIIWFKALGSKKMIVSFPDVVGGESAGFLDKAIYKEYRMKDSTFIKNFAEELQDILVEAKLVCEDGIKCKYVFENFYGAFENYKKQLPIVDNLHINCAHPRERADVKMAILGAQRNIRTVYCGQEQYGNAEIFYKSYVRTLEIDAAKTSGKIVVKTTLEFVLVNLSQEDHTEWFAPQFLEKDGGFDTYKVNAVEVNGSDAYAKIENYLQGEPVRYGPYIVPEEFPITVKAHSADSVKIVSTYEIAIGLFFTAKVVSFPCGTYSFIAGFGPSFRQVFGDDYIFRFQIIPPDPHNLNNRIVPHEMNGEANDKKYVSQHYGLGFPAGGGYALTVSKRMR